MEEIILCSECHKNPVHITKRGLCRLCYSKLRNKEGSVLDINNLCKPTKELYDKKREIEFIKNYFTHNNWIHRPAMFFFNGEKYTLDFYDGDRNVFIEVAGSRQAYHQNKDKYILFRRCFPKINFEIYKPDGTILNEDSHKKEW